MNALTALVRRHALGVDARKALRSAQTLEMSRWRDRKEKLAVSVARTETISLTKYIVGLDDQLKDNDQQLTDLVTISEAAPLLQEPGFGAIGAAKCLVAWSHHGRSQTEAEFAALAGANPFPASSGNTPDIGSTAVLTGP